MAELFIGLMSGTSMDGIDAALVDFSSLRPRILGTHKEPYPAALQKQLAAAMQLEDPLGQDLSPLDEETGQCFARAANRLLELAGMESSAIRAIGSHGQTLRHEPGAAQPYSLQTGSPGVIANATRIDVVADFRRADIEAGGQGAPLVPAFHRAVFASPAEDRVVLNIGGIANITVLPADPARPVTGFDTGPGNTLMDHWAQRHLDTAMDVDGQWAASGTPDQALLARLLQDPYFNRPPPKSTGPEYFNLDWLSSQTGGATIAPADLQATLCELTAASIAKAIGRHAPGTKRLLVCGGGIHNRALMRRLQETLKALEPESTAAHGIDPDWVEAAAFAWLARQRLAGQPGNIPAVTGASRPVLLGRLTRAPGSRESGTPQGSAD